MALYQNTSVDSTKLILGNAKIETCATVGGTYVNLGAGIVNSFVHNIEKYDSQAGNAPDPIEGIADESVVVEFEMIEYDGSVLSAIMCGLITETHTTVLSTIAAGGNQQLTPRVFRITNTSTLSSTTVETIMTVFKATLNTGPAINFKSDSDTDPVSIMPCTLTGKPDTTLTVGSQLYSLTRTLVE